MLCDILKKLHSGNNNLNYFCNIKSKMSEFPFISFVLCKVTESVWLRPCEDDPREPSMGKPILGHHLAATPR